MISADIVFVYTLNRLIGHRTSMLTRYEHVGVAIKVCATYDDFMYIHILFKFNHELCYIMRNKINVNTFTTLI